MKITANALSASRIVLTVPIVVLYTIGLPILLCVGWVIHVIAEITDILDGWFARRNNEETPLGKVLDPAADVFIHGLVFITFVDKGWMPGLMLCAILGREISITFLRTALALAQGKSYSSRIIGKAKTWVYALSQLAVVLLHILVWFGIEVPNLDEITFYILVAPTAMALISWPIYAIHMWRNLRQAVS